jgi:DNA invertase Pin-like site-specific DNA recombinase
MVEILYCRVSNVNQKTDHQRVNEKDFKIVIEDKCSGSVPFFEREGGKQVLTYINKGLLTSLSVCSIDRLGINFRDILYIIHFFNEKNIPIIFLSQGLRTIDENGKENDITQLMISILGNVGEIKRSQI